VRKSHSIPDFQQKVRTETNTGEHIMLNMTHNQDQVCLGSFNVPLEKN
jgi:hypothetical protein